MFVPPAPVYSFAPAPDMYATWEGDADAQRVGNAWKSGGDGQGPYGEPRRSTSTDVQAYQGPPSGYSHER